MSLPTHAEHSVPTASLYILTGASRGLGAALAEQLLAPHVVLLCIARLPHPELNARARAVGARVEQWRRDLSHPAEVALALEGWLQAVDTGRFDEATLINNAGVMSRIGPLHECDDADLSRAMRVGLEAPVLLSATFLRETVRWRGRRRILNISSGLGRRAMAGAATYCAAKAGLDHFSRAVALEEARRSNGARIVSLAPGVIDTDMQSQLRQADPRGFPDSERFLGLQRQGELATPAEAAARVIAWLRRPDFGDTVVADVRDR